MSSSSTKTMNLPWHQHDHYWLCVYPFSGALSAGLQDMMLRVGGLVQSDGGMAAKAPKQWKPMWDTVYEGLKQQQALAQVEVALCSGEMPPHSRSEAACKTPLQLQNIAESLWLGEALLDGRVMCYLQPVHSSKERVFGYESFARVRDLDGSIIGGDRIVAASKVLGMEYMIDRHLQVEAIKTFAASQFNGFLFVNFFPGFIHRPSVYLEGLSETAKQYGIVSKHLVLDFTNSEKPRDAAHIRSVCEYGRSKGYSVALDDLSSVEATRRLVDEVKPDFVKIDMHLVQSDSYAARDTIRAMAEIVHASGGALIAEGVETEAMFTAMRQLNVDLFQGYYFAAPAPVEVALARSAAG